MNLNPKSNRIASNQKIMSTTHTLTASGASGLARKPNTVGKTATKPGNRKKIFELGLLAVASGTTIVLVFKAATIINELLVMIDATYKNFCT
jgi:hypothetical protein